MGRQRGQGARSSSNIATATIRPFTFLSFPCRSNSNPTYPTRHDLSHALKRQRKGSSNLARTRTPRLRLSTARRTCGQIQGRKEGGGTASTVDFSECYFFLVRRKTATRYAECDGWHSSMCPVVVIVIGLGGCIDWGLWRTYAGPPFCCNCIVS